MPSFGQRGGVGRGRKRARFHVGGTRAIRCPQRRATHTRRFQIHPSIGSPPKNKQPRNEVKWRQFSFMNTTERQQLKITRLWFPQPSTPVKRVSGLTEIDKNGPAVVTGQQASADEDRRVMNARIRHLHDSQLVRDCVAENSRWTRIRPARAAVRRCLDPRDERRRRRRRHGSSGPETMTGSGDVTRRTSAHGATGGAGSRWRRPDRAGRLCLAAGSCSNGAERRSLTNSLEAR